MRWIMSLFGRPGRIHPVTQFDVTPAPVPNQRLEEELDRGRVMLNHHVASAERSVASLYHQFAAQAADRSRS